MYNELEKRLFVHKDKEIIFCIIKTTEAFWANTVITKKIKTDKLFICLFLYYSFILEGAQQFLPSKRNSLRAGDCASGVFHTQGSLQQIISSWVCF